MRALEWVWNPRERRVRAVVRLVGQFVLYLVLLGAPGPLITNLLMADVGGMPLGRHPAGGALADAVSGTSSLVAALASVAIAARWLDRQRLRDLGLALNWQWWRDLLAGLGLGAALAGGLFVALLAAGWVEVTDVSAVPAEANPALVAALVLVGVVGSAIGAELLARGYQLTNIAEGLTGWLGLRGSVRAAVLVSAALSGLLYAAWPLATLLGTASMIAAGLFFAIGYALTGRLGLPLGAHLAWNLVRGPLLGLPNEDTGAGPASLLVTEPTGPELVTGNALGPEAGLAGLAAFLTGTAAMLAWARLTRGTVPLADSIARPRPDRHDTTEQPTAQT